MDFPEHARGWCSAFLDPCFVTTMGTDLGEKHRGRAVDFKALPTCLSPMGLWITGLRSWWRSVIFLTSLDLSERLVVLG